jgi:predicted protein tyrosine phosphatase
MNLNRLANLNNPFQGKRKRVLCVCSAGLLRSPTLAWILSNEPYNFNTRSCGAAPEYALIPLEEGLVRWADEIICVEPWQEALVKNYYKEANVVTLEIPDRFQMRDPELVEIAQQKLKEHYENITT